MKTALLLVALAVTGLLLPAATAAQAHSNSGSSAPTVIVGNESAVESLKTCFSEYVANLKTCKKEFCPNVLLNCDQRAYSSCRSTARAQFDNCTSPCASCGA